MGRDLNADDLPSDVGGIPDDLGGSDSQDFNDELTAIAGGQNIPAETQALAEEQRHDESIEMLEGLRTLQGAESIRWKIYRIKSENPDDDGYLEEVSTARLNMDYLRDQYGPGVYRVRGQWTRGGKFAAQRTIIIAKGAKQKVTGTQNAQNSGFDIQAFLAQQDARDAARRREQEEREEKRRRERMELITVLGPVVAPIVAAMVGNRGPDLSTLVAALKPEPGPSMVELLQALQAMRQLDQSTAPPQEDSTDKIFKIVNLLREAGIGGEGKVDLWDIAKEVVKQIGPGVGQALGSVAQMIQARQQAQAQMPAALPSGAPALLAPTTPPFGSGVVPGSAIPLPGAAPSIASAVPPAGSPRSPAGGASTATAPSASLSIDPAKADAMGLLDLLPLASHLPWLKGHIENLLVRAARGSDPELYAELMLDDFPQGADPRVLGQLLARHDWFALVKQLDARAAQYEAWFNDFRTAILGMIQEETGVSFGIQTVGGTDPQTGRQVINVNGGVSDSQDAPDQS